MSPRVSGVSTGVAFEVASMPRLKKATGVLYELTVVGLKLTVKRLGIREKKSHTGIDRSADALDSPSPQCRALSRAERRKLRVLRNHPCLSSYNFSLGPESARDVNSKP